MAAVKSLTIGPAVCTEAEPKTISENTLRHGFVPPEDLQDD